MPENIVLEGTAEYDAALRKLTELILDLRPFWPLVVPIFVGWMGKQFDSEGDFFGQQWAPLSEPYATWKMQHYPGKGILSAEGDLRRAATTPERISRPESLVLRIKPYEKSGKAMDPDWFQSGTDRMPARPLLADELPLEAQAELREAANYYIDENARKLGLLAR